ncbi:MAG: hypothetical protein N7Q72_05750, partial [Spiroplasma sp. Tabriz.8]|nr:hypothetical protein [Spiroplasma sp. Tabriz.8]
FEIWATSSPWELIFTNLIEGSTSSSILPLIKSITSLKVCIYIYIYIYIWTIASSWRFNHSPISP